MRAVALTLALSMTACFPHNARHRTIAKVSEGVSLVSGIAILAVVNSGADCDAMMMPGLEDPDCEGNANILSTIGLGLIMLGLGGFIVTVSATPDDDDPSSASTITPPPITPPAVEPPPVEPARPTAPAPAP